MVVSSWWRFQVVMMEYKVSHCDDGRWRWMLRYRYAATVHTNHSPNTNTLFHTIISHTVRTAYIVRTSTSLITQHSTHQHNQNNSFHSSHHSPSLRDCSTHPSDRSRSARASPVSDVVGGDDGWESRNEMNCRVNNENGNKTSMYEWKA